MTNDELIYSTAIADGMPDALALFIVAQARHETGSYSHRFFTVGNNAFGYSYVEGGKWQLDKGGPLADNGIAIAQYSSVKNSVHELTDWIKRRQASGVFPTNLNTIDTPQKYAQLLKNGGYYGAPLQTYTDALVNWVRKISGEVFNAKTGSLLLVTAVLVFIFRKNIFGSK